MLDRIPLRTFIDAIPALPTPLNERGADAHFSTRSTLPADYVWPELRINDRAAAVVLISAPGAMGKSYTSRAVAHALTAPRMDLAGERVGKNTLTGGLFKSLGPQGAAGYITELAAGRAALILDGVDEAQLLAGREHFLAFLEDLADLARGAEGAHQIILLGRPDSMVVTETALYEYGILCSTAELSPLNRSEAVEMIDNSLDRLVKDGHPYGIHRQHVEPFGRLRDAVWQDISNALGNTDDISTADAWDKVRDFLGYPPVLLALSTRLSVDNPHDELARITSDRRGDQREERGELLKQIVENILDRESVKVRSRIAEALELGPNDLRVNVLYSRSEQVLRVLLAVASSPLAPLSPAVLTVSERAVYDEQIGSFVQDHPLLIDGKIANAVFADFVRAFINSADDADLHGLDRAALLAACQPVGPFFVHFMAGLTAPNSSNFGRATEELVDDLIRSHVAGSSSPSTLFVYSHDEDASHAHLSLMSGDYDSPDPSSHILFHIENPAGLVELRSPVSRGVIMTSYGVIIEPSRDQLELGPMLMISAGELELHGEMLYANSREGAQGVTIFTEKLQHDPSLKIAGAQDGLIVSTPTAPGYQWRAYHFDLPAAQKENLAHRYQLLLSTRRILTSFRSGAGSPALHCDMLDHLVVGSSHAARVALEGLTDLGIVARQGAMYVLNSDNLQPFGVSYASLGKPDFAGHLRRLVDEMAKLDSVRSFLARD